jgi:hypothetical protein
MRRTVPGPLPNIMWLRGNGYLYQAMRKHPEAFAHNPQERLR